MELGWPPWLLGRVLVLRSSGMTLSRSTSRLKTPLSHFGRLPVTYAGTFNSLNGSLMPHNEYGNVAAPSWEPRFQRKRPGSPRIAKDLFQLPFP